MIGFRDHLRDFSYKFCSITCTGYHIKWEPTNFCDIQFPMRCERSRRCAHIHSVKMSVPRKTIIHVVSIIHAGLSSNFIRYLTAYQWVIYFAHSLLILKKNSLDYNFFYYFIKCFTCWIIKKGIIEHGIVCVF